MKRILSLILATMLILAAVPAFAETPDVTGTWVFSTTDKYGTSVEVIILLKGGTLYYVNQAFSGDKVEFGRQFVGNWNFFTENVYMRYGNNAKDYFRLSEDGTTLTSTTLPGLVFVKVGR